LPGSSTFQRTFFVSLHSTGGEASGATPVMSGPRHWGQKRSALPLGLADHAGSDRDAAATKKKESTRRLDTMVSSRQAGLSSNQLNPPQGVTTLASPNGSSSALTCASSPTTTTVWRDDGK
jgi:hypothetical protein